MEPNVAESGNSNNEAKTYNISSSYYYNMSHAQMLVA